MTAPLQEVFMDVIGPVPVRGQKGDKYVLVLVDAFTGMYFVRPIRKKSDVKSRVMEFKIWADRYWSIGFGEAMLTPKLVKFCSGESL